MTESRKLRLRDLEEPAGTVTLPNPSNLQEDGREIAIRHIDALGMDLVERLNAGKAEPREVWALARRILPDATEEEIGLLTPPLIGHLANVACGELESVLEFARSRGNSEAPEPTVPAPESPSAPGIGDGTSSPE